jgi:hypothetical protein
MMFSEINTWDEGRNEVRFEGGETEQKAWNSSREHQPTNALTEKVQDKRVPIYICLHAPPTRESTNNDGSDATSRHPRPF